MSLERYYRFHARIYDATRWSFLFGRRGVLEHVTDRFDPLTVLEVGCGTGSNLRYLAVRYRRARFLGIDLSRDMLSKARVKLREHDGRIDLVHGRFPQCAAPGARFALILFSYALSMFGAESVDAVSAAKALLSDNGVIAVVDFHDSNLPGFKRWMHLNHVRVDTHLLSTLEHRFGIRRVAVRPAFFGAWTYFTFLGDKRGVAKALL